MLSEELFTVGKVYDSVDDVKKDISLYNNAAGSQDNNAAGSQDNNAAGSQDNNAAGSQDNNAAGSQDNNAAGSQDNNAAGSQDNNAAGIKTTMLLVVKRLLNHNLLPVHVVTKISQEVLQSHVSGQQPLPALQLLIYRNPAATKSRRRKVERCLG